MPSQLVLKAQAIEILGEEYNGYYATTYTLSENLENSKALVVVQLSQVGKGHIMAVEGTGVGFIDALFNGIKHGLVGEYPSLGHIHFVDFVVSGNFKTLTGKGGAHSDVPGTVRLVIENNTGREFTFEDTSVSVSASSVAVVLMALEHFVNAEKAVLKVVTWIEDAKRRTRPELVDKYTQRLVELVQNASYSETIARVREGDNKRV